MDYIKALLKALGKKAIYIYLPIKPGEAPETYAICQ